MIIMQMIVLIAPRIIGRDNQSGHNTPPQGWVEQTTSKHQD